MENPTGWQKVQIFGQVIDTGPVTITAEEVVALDGEETFKKYLAAPEGAAIDWKGICNGLCRFVAGTNPGPGGAECCEISSAKPSGESE